MCCKEGKRVSDKPELYLTERSGSWTASSPLRSGVAAQSGCSALGIFLLLSALPVPGELSGVVQMNASAGVWRRLRGESP